MRDHAMRRVRSLLVSYGNKTIVDAVNICKCVINQKGAGKD
jgi:hypothetical protein